MAENETTAEPTDSGEGSPKYYDPFRPHARGTAEGEIGPGRQSKKEGNEPDSPKERRDVPLKDRLPERGFVQIQHDLEEVLLSADPNLSAEDKRNKEQQLRMDRERIVREARDGELNLFSGLDDEIKNILGGEADYEEAIRRVRDINTLEYEDAAQGAIDAKGESLWDERYAGMLSERRDIAALDMELALLKAGEEADKVRGFSAPGSKKDIEDLEKEIKIRRFSGGSPTGEAFFRARTFVMGTPEQRMEEIASQILIESRSVAAQREEAIGHRKRIERAVREIRERGNNPEEWAVLVLEELDAAETNAEKSRKRSEPSEDDRIWAAVRDAIDVIPTGLGEVDTTSELARFLRKDYPKGLDLKDRLDLYFTARKNLSDRYVEIIRAGGSLTAMGLGRDEVPFEGISYKLQRIQAQDWWCYYHGDEIFPELSRLSREEVRELAPDVSTASAIWMEVGIRYDTLPDYLLTAEEKLTIEFLISNKAGILRYYENKHRLRPEVFTSKDLKKVRDKINKMTKDKGWLPADIAGEAFLGMSVTREALDNFLDIYMRIPTFKQSRNSSDLLADLRARMRTFETDNWLRARQLGSGQKDLDLPGYQPAQGLSGGRKAEDLANRVLTVTLTMELLDGDRSSVQGKSEARDTMWSERQRKFDYADKQREPGEDWTIARYFAAEDQGEAVKADSPKMARRKLMLQINSERAVIADREGYFEGQWVSDFLHQFVFAPDKLRPGAVIRRTMASYVLNRDGTVKYQGFRNVPFLTLGDEAYAGYFGYTLGRAKAIGTETSGQTWKDPKELATQGWWNSKRQLFDRLEHLSPYYTTKEFQWRGYLIREVLRKDGRFNPAEIDKISGVSDPEEDLSVISDSALRREAINLIREKSIEPYWLPEEDPKKVPKRTLLERADKIAEEYLKQFVDKTRFVHALGAIWPGTLDALEGTAETFTESEITPTQMADIIKAIIASNYLSPEAMDLFRNEVWNEMGIGRRWSAGKRRRYRIRPDGTTYFP